MGDIRIKDMPEVNMKNKRITELLEQIQKDFQTSSENIGKIKGLLEDEDKGITIEFPSLKPGRKFHIINDSDREVTVEGNPNGTVTIKPGETKKFPESAPKINSYEDAVRFLKPKLSIHDEHNLYTSEESATDTYKYNRRKLIAEALGARPFVSGARNYYIEKDFRENEWRLDYLEEIGSEGINFFPSDKQANRYMWICLKEGLL